MYSRCCCLVAKSCPTLCDPVNGNTPGSSVLHYFRVCSSSCSLSQYYLTISSSAAPFLFCLQSFPASVSFQWVGSSHHMAKVLELQLQHQSFQRIFSWFPLGLTGFNSLQSKRLLGIFSNTTIRKHQPSLWSSCHIHIWLHENHNFDYTDFVSKVMSLLFNMLSLSYPPVPI